MYCKDLKQLYDSTEKEIEMPTQEKKHNALDDAKWNKDFYNCIMESKK